MQSVSVFLDITRVADFSRLPPDHENLEKALNVEMDLENLKNLENLEN